MSKRRKSKQDEHPTNDTASGGQYRPDPSICAHFIPLPDPSKLTYEEIIEIFGRERVERFQREIYRIGLAKLAQRAQQAQAQPLEGEAP